MIWYIIHNNLYILSNFKGLRRLPTESPALAESIGDIRALLQQILSDAAPRGSGKVVRGAHRGARLASTILDECHSTFVECYHALYPTAWLKWTSLCYLLHTQVKTLLFII